jgi:hypothetical protein
MFSGLILGVLLTVGAAYVHDTGMGPRGDGPVPPEAVGRGQIVNWDVLGAVTHDGMNFAKRKWNDLTGH